jgi:hypothetical protein
MPSSPTISTADLQPSLLEERREWVKHDREVKLDIFLSLAEEVMLELFEVGPPLPPSNMNAQEMLEALEERFAVFKFESYHHTFCHFLNLHIDQYSSIEEFNTEFLTTLEDLLDHGHPLSNVQACSAYFSKLRCTQNPWVAKMLEGWDAQGEVDCRELLKQSPPWSIIRPLATKASQSFLVESIPEEYLEDSSASDSDSALEKSDASTVSSISLHSRNASTTIVDVAPVQDVVEPERQHSVLTTRSQEITIQASLEAIAEMESQAFHKELGKLPTSAIPERGSSKIQVPGKLLSDDPNGPLPEWLASKKSVARKAPPPTDRPLPPLPPQAEETKEISLLTSQAVLPKTTPSPPTSSSLFPALRLETTHPTLRPQTSAPLIDTHPALRSDPPVSTDKAPLLSQSLPTIDTTPLSFPFPTMTSQNTPRASDQEALSSTEPQRPSLADHKRPSSTSIYPTSRRPSFSTPNLAIPWPCTPDIAPPRPQSSRAALPATQAPNPMPSQAPSQDHDSSCDEEEDDGMDVDLPLQGTRDSAWDYLYEAKGGYLVTQTTRTPSSSATSSPPQQCSTTFVDVVVPPKHSVHKKSSNLDFVARLSGESIYEATEKDKRFMKKKSWINGVNLARFSAGKGVREII